MKILALLVLSFVLIAPAEAQKNNKKEKEEEKKRKREENENRRNALDEFIKPRDKNKDGSLTLDEFLNVEIDKDAAKKKFEQYNENGDRYLTRSEIASMLGL